jgi:hypothetical protein
MLGVSPHTIRSAIQRGIMAYEQINPRLNMVTLQAVETYRRERLGQRGGYRGGAGRRPKPEASMPSDSPSAERGDGR